MNELRLLSPHLTLYERAWDEQRRCSTERWFVVDVATGVVSRNAQTTEAYTKCELVDLFRSAGFAEVEVLPRMIGSPEVGALCCVLATS